MTGPSPRRGERRYVYQSAAMRAAAAALDALGAAAVTAATLGRGLRAEASALAAPRRILAVRLDHLGDVLFARPACEALKRRFPQARLTVLTSSLGAEFLGRDPAIDETLVWDAPWFARGRRPAGQPGFLALARDLRRRRFDLSLEFRGDLRHHVLLWLAGVKARLGYGVTGGGFLQHRTLPLRVGAHEVERDLDLAAAAGAAERPDRYRPLLLREGERERALALWSGGGARVAVHPAAGDPAKCWPPERFAGVCDALAESGASVILVGTAGERPRAEAVRAACRRPPANRCGETTPAGLLAAVSAAALVVGNDSGPAHLALTQGVPAVVLWSETNDPAEWGPWGAGVRAEVVRHPGRAEAAAQAEAAARRLLGR